MKATSLLVALVCTPLSSAFQLVPRGAAGVRWPVRLSSPCRADPCLVGDGEGDSPRSWLEQLGIPPFPNPFKSWDSLLADQLNAKSSITGRSVIEDVEEKTRAIFGDAGKDFVVGQKACCTEAARFLGASGTEAARFLGLAIVSSVVVTTTELSMTSKYAYGALVLAKAVYEEIRCALCQMTPRQMSQMTPPFDSPCASCIGSGKGSERPSTTSKLCLTSPLLLLRRCRWV